MQLDLLALGIFARVKRDGHFKDAVFALKDLGGKFRLKVEAIGTDHHTIDHLLTEYLVAGFHIGQDGIVKDIRH